MLEDWDIKLLMGLNKNAEYELQNKKPCKALHIYETPFYHWITYISRSQIYR